MGEPASLEELISDPRVAEALTDLQQYLSDAAAPLVVADSMTILTALPPALAATEIRAWTAAQYRHQGTAIPVSDYIFHAMRKIHILGEFRLVPEDTLAPFLQSLQELVIDQCPEEDRELLRENLANLGEGHSVTTPAVGVLYRQRGSERPLAAGEVSQVGGTIGPETVAPITSAAAAGGPATSRRLGLLLHRLEQRLTTYPTPPPADDSRLAGTLAHVLSQAAGEAATTEEFRATLGELRGRGLETRLDQVIRLLGRALPAWSPAGSANGTGAPLASAPAQAIQRLVALEKDPAEAARRFTEMVQVGVDLFNQGQLGRAATIFDLAERVVSEQRTDSGTVAAVRAREAERLDGTRLRASAEDGASFPSLRRVLRFFPTLQPHALLETLRTEERRERRRLLVALLESYGPEARDLALRQLAESADSFADTDSYFQRNLLYLLRRIPRGEDTPVEGELALLVLLSEPGRPLALVKEAITSLGAWKHQLAEQTLLQRAAEVEALLGHPTDAPHPAAELTSLLDRIVHALAHLGTPSAIRAVVEHGLRPAAQLGDVTNRLTYLSDLDLSGDAATVARLLKALHASLPQRVFGITLPRGSGSALALIESLSGTPAPEVKAALEDIVSRFSGRDVADTAQKVLTGFSTSLSPSNAPPPQMSGDLEVLGLPSLLQNLSQSRISGVLSILDHEGREVGSVVWSNGLVAETSCGPLRGETAFYQLLEKPILGSFVFVVQRPDGSGRTDGRGGRDVLPLLMEGMRRFDEFQRDRDLAPDSATFRATAGKPTNPPDEADRSLVQATWLAAVSGVTAHDCETDLGCDAFRVRRLLAHWLEEGALVLRETPGDTGT